MGCGRKEWLTGWETDRGGHLEHRDSLTLRPRPGHKLGILWGISDWKNEKNSILGHVKIIWNLDCKVYDSRSVGMHHMHSLHVSCRAIFTLQGGVTWLPQETNAPQAENTTCPFTKSTDPCHKAKWEEVEDCFLKASSDLPFIYLSMK